MKITGSHGEPTVRASPFAPEMPATDPSPSQTEISMPTIVLHLGKCTKPAPVCRHYAVAGTVATAILCETVLLSRCQPSSDAPKIIAPEPAWPRAPLGVPPMISTLRGLP